ncbi:MAG: hypothetical protein M3032_06220, partial [Verrucomicrobiota bacterium]|nr:hypothetical protein [Verrucomicrobiota bacterium]
MLRLLFTSIILLLLSLASARAQEVEVETNDLAAFLRGVEMRNLRWRTFDTSEVKVYYCTAEPPRTGAAGIELGGKPFVIRVNEADIPIDGSFGRFQVKWFRRTIKDGSRQAETTFRCGQRQWAHVIVEARDELGVLQFISEFGRLALFAPTTKQERYAGPGLVDP